MLPSPDYWLQQWLFSQQPYYPSQVPITASLVHTLLCAPAWYSMLISHPNRQLVQFMLRGIGEGFRIGFSRQPSSLESARCNLKGARDHPDVVSDYLSTELSPWLNCTFSPAAVSQVHISRFGEIPKGHTGRWRLIVDLSHPLGHSMNDGIPKHLCSLKYVTIDEAIKGIIQLGQGTLLAKIDIQSAFRSTQQIGTC